MKQNIGKDFQTFATGPKEFTRDLLGGKVNFELNKTTFIFIFFMQTYFVFVPSFFFALNLVSVVVVLLLINLIYYASQDLYLKYSEEQDQGIADKKFYKVAYLFALAGLPGFVLNLISSIFALMFLNNFLVTAFVLLPVSLFIALFVFYLSLKVFSACDPETHSLISIFTVTIAAFITGVKNQFGIQAIKEIYEDWKTLDSKVALDE